MKVSPQEIPKVSREMLERLQESDYRSRLSTVWSQQAEIIIAAIVALIVPIVLLVEGL